MTFLRPFWLLLLVAPLALWLMKKTLPGNNPWTRYVDKELLSFLTVRQTGKKSKLSLFLTLLWSLLTLALAGPALNQTAAPAYLPLNSTVIIADLNPALTDASLIKLKTKIYDALTLLPDEQIALVLYDEKGYVVTPLTHDKNILKNMIPTLSPTIMPAGANNPRAGFERARELFQNLNLTEGRILFITTGNFDPAPLAAFVQKTPYKITTLLIPQDNIFPDTAALENIGALHTWTLNDADLATLINQTPTAAENTATYTMKIPQDLGPYILLGVLPLLALLFRRGVFFLLILTLAFPAEAAFFKRSDQVAYTNARRAERAFGQKNYDRAAALYARNADADSFYNAGNALAFAGKIPEAINAYDDALAFDPTHADAKFNKEFLEKHLPSAAGQSNADNADTDKSESQQTTPAAPSDDAQQTNNTTESGESSKSNAPAEDTRDNDTATPTSVAPQDSAELTAKDQPDTRAESEKQQILNRIQEDPSRLIRYRLYQQYRWQP